MVIQSADFRAGCQGCLCLGFAFRDCSPETRTIKNIGNQGFAPINLFTCFWDFPVFGLTIHPCRKTKRHRAASIDRHHPLDIHNLHDKQAHTDESALPKRHVGRSKRQVALEHNQRTRPSVGYVRKANFASLSGQSGKQLPGACNSREMPGGPLARVAKPKHRVRCFGFQQEVLWT